MSASQAEPVQFCLTPICRDEIAISQFSNVVLLPGEILEAILAAIKVAQPFSEVPLLVYFSRFTSSITDLTFRNACVPLIRACLFCASSGYLCSVTSISLQSNTNDSLVRALADSSVSQTLTELKIGPFASNLTDDSAHCWLRFSSLKTLSLGGRYLTEASFNEIVTKLPSLTSLSLSTSCVSNRVTLAKVLGGKGINLPLLENLKVRCLAMLSEAPRLLSLLRANHPLRQSLRQLSVGVTSESDSFEICELCPNLRTVDYLTPCWPEGVQRLASKTKHLESLTIRMDHVSNSVFTQSDVEYLAQTFPKLTSLSFGGEFNFQASSLQPLTDLAKLKIVCQSWRCFSFPPTLTQLDVGVVEEFPSSAFLDCLPKELEQLRVLYLSARSIAAPIRLAIVSALPRLLRASISDSFDSVADSPLLQVRSEVKTAPPSRLALSHPTLQTFSLLDYLTYFPSDLPALKDLTVTSELLPCLSRRMTSLRSVSLPDASLCNLKRLYVLPGLRRISCFNLSRSQLTDLGAISALYELQLDHLSGVNESHIAALLENLPLLRNLTVGLGDDEDPFTSFEWLKHDKLRKFKYAGRATSKDGDEGLPVVPIALAASPISLPFLRSLTLNLRLERTAEIIVENLPTLETLSIEPKSCFDAEDCDFARVRVRNCRSLAAIEIRRGSLALLELRSLPTLISLIVSCLMLEVEYILDVPSLRSAQARPAEATQAMRDNATARFASAVGSLPLNEID